MTAIALPAEPAARGYFPQETLREIAFGMMERGRVADDDVIGTVRVRIQRIERQKGWTDPDERAVLGEAAKVAAIVAYARIERRMNGIPNAGDRLYVGPGDRVDGGLATVDFVREDHTQRHATRYTIAFKEMPGHLYGLESLMERQAGYARLYEGRSARASRE